MPVYLYHNAISPMPPEVADAMKQFSQSRSAIPSSLHAAGRMARSAVTAAAARLVKRKRGNPLFTGGQQEPHRPAGNENVWGIVNLGKAAQFTDLEIEQNGHYLRQPRDPFESRLARGLDANLALNGIRVSFGMDDSFQDTEASIVKLQQLVNKPPAVIRQAAA